jgi:hypothetical protein
MLSVVVARDNATPLLSEEEYRRIENAAVRYLADEQDVRGYDPGKGWIHSAAHTADLIKFMGRSRYLERGGQERFLDAIAGKLTAAPVVFVNGEDERFARAVLSLVNRKDFDADAFRGWVVRTKPGPPNGPKPPVEALRSAQNIKNLFAKLEVLLSLDPQPSAASQSARDALRAALKDLF